ncbi:MAG: SDR family oxidoreductase [Rhodospirillaceae bacterium]|nr:SDR family oxidoreductase [Rhodospirillaceae bacterium]
MALQLGRRRALGAIALALATWPAAAAGKRIIVFGASRETGLEVTKILAARGDVVTAFVRPGSDRGGLAPLGVAYAVGDALEPASLQAAFAAQRYDAVICTIGGSRGDRRPDYEGVRNIVDAAKAAGVKRFVLVTVIGAGDSWNAVSDRVKQVLGPVIELKTKAEAHLTASGLDYTIVRPGGLNDLPAAGKGRLYDDHMTMGEIGRADLAQLVVQALDDDATIGRIYHAIDEEMLGKPPM